MIVFSLQDSRCKEGADGDGHQIRTLVPSMPHTISLVLDDIPLGTKEGVPEDSHEQVQEVLEWARPRCGRVCGPYASKKTKQDNHQHSKKDSSHSCCFLLLYVDGCTCEHSDSRSKVT